MIQPSDQQSLKMADESFDAIVPAPLSVPRSAQPVSEEPAAGAPAAEAATAEMPPESGEGESWYVVIGVALINLATLPAVQCFGLIYEHVFQELGMTTVAITFLFHINGGVASVLSLLCSPFLKRYSYRIMSIIGSIICSISICLLSVANSWASFLLTYSILIGIGQGILFTSTTLAINTHFKVRRSLAVGMSVALSSFGPIISPHIVNILYSHFGTFGCVFILGAVSLNSLAGALLLRPTHSFQKCDNTKKKSLLEVQNTNDHKQDTHEMNDGFVKSSSPLKLTEQENEDQHFCDEPKGKGHSIAKEFYKRVGKALDLDLLKDPIYVNIAVGLGFAIASEYNFQVLFPFVLVDMSGLKKTELAFIMSVQAVADILVRVITPIVANWLNWNSRVVFMISLFSSMIGRSVLAHFHHGSVMLVIVAVILGIGKGLKAVFQAIIIPNHVPLEKLPAANGIYMIMNGTFSLICGPLIGLIRDNWGSYVAALYASSGLSFLCVISWTVEYLLRRRRLKMTHEISLEECKSHSI